MKVEFPFVRVVFVTLAMAVLGYLVFPLFGMDAVDPRLVFAAGLIAGTLSGALVTAVRSEAQVSHQGPVPGMAAAPAAAPGELQSVFVGNLSYRATREDLEGLFAPFGMVHSSRIMTDRVTRRPRGFGFVEMDGAAASKAIGALDGKEFLGRTIKVSLGKNRSRQED